MEAISVVVPVFNEEGNTHPLHAALVEALTGREFEVIYVNDGSGTSTLSATTDRLPL